MKKLIFTITLLSSVPTLACVAFNVTAFYKMCQTDTCGYPAPVKALAKVDFNAKNEALLKSRLPVSDTLEIEYALFVRHVPQNKSYFVKISTTFFKRNHPYFYSEKSDFIYDLEKFSSLNLEGEPLMGDGYKWMPYLTLEPAAQSGVCQ